MHLIKSLIESSFRDIHISELESGKHETLSDLKAKYKWNDNNVGDFIARNLKLKSLKGCPTNVNGDFNVSNNDLKSLEHAPKYVGGSYCISDNPNLSTLQYVPEIINGDFLCDGCNLSQDSLQYLPKYINGSFDLTDNLKITSLHNIHYHINFIKYRIYIPHSIKSHIMGLMKIKGLTNVNAIHIGTITNPDAQKACEIMNRHLDGKGNFFDCLEELEDAGLEEFAQL